jgi:hypothetical protein
MMDLRELLPPFFSRVRNILDFLFSFVYIPSSQFWLCELTPARNSRHEVVLVLPIWLVVAIVLVLIHGIARHLLLVVFSNSPSSFGHATRPVLFEGPTDILSDSRGSTGNDKVMNGGDPHAALPPGRGYASLRLTAGLLRRDPRAELRQRHSPCTDKHEDECEGMEDVGDRDVDSDHDAGLRLVRQPVELCFHADFIPRPSSRLSLHISAPRNRASIPITRTTVESLSRKGEVEDDNDEQVNDIKEVDKSVRDSRRRRPLQNPSGPGEYVVEMEGVMAIRPDRKANKVEGSADEDVDEWEDEQSSLGSMSPEEGEVVDEASWGQEGEEDNEQVQEQEEGEFHRPHGYLHHNTDG